MAKQPWINLNNWSLWMSSDEYTGWSFLYSQWLNISKSSKSIRISDRLIESTITNRANANHIAIVWPYSSDWIIAFSTDWYLESNTTYYGNNVSSDIGWALFKRDNTSDWYINGIKIWNETRWITLDWIDIFTWDLFHATNGIFNPWSNVVANPYLTSDTSWSGLTWRTTWANGAVHTSGTTLLEQAITVDYANKVRIAVRMTWCTTGTCQIRFRDWWTNTIWWTLSATSDNWTMYTINNPTWTRTHINFNPSTDFNGTISYVSVCEYNMTRVQEDNIAITSSTSHPLLYIWHHLYIWSGASLDVVDTLTHSVDTFNLIESTYTIKDIYQVWQSLVLFATDWEDSKHYYWDMVSDAPSEVILWKDKIITWVSVDWTNMYVVCENDYTKELWIASGYDKKLIAVGRRDHQWLSQDKEVTRLSQRNNFYHNPVWSNAMWFTWNKLFVPSYYGIYTYWFSNPWMPSAILKERVLDTVWISCMSNIQWLTYIAYRTITDAVAKIWYIRERANQYWTNAYFVTNPILRDNFSTKKQLERFRIWYILHNSNESLDIYLGADKNYFRTFTVSWVTVNPTQWATYRTWETSSPYNIYEVISTDITAWVGTISCRRTNLIYDSFDASTTLTKISWTWDSSISSSDSDAFIKVKSITTTTYIQWEDLIFWQELLASFMPDWHTIQLKIKFNSTSSNSTPEVFDIPFLAEPVWQNG